MSDTASWVKVAFVIVIPVALTSFGLWAMRLAPGPGAMFLKKTEDNAAPDIGVGGPLGGLASGLPIPGGAAALTGLAGGLSTGLAGGLSTGLASKIPIPGGAAALTDLTSGKIPGNIASKIPIPGGADALTGLASGKMPSSIEMANFSKDGNPLTAMAANPLSAVAGGKLPDMSVTNPLSAMAANKTNAVIAQQTADAEKAIAQQTADAEKAVAVNTKETERQLRLAAAEKRKNLEASIQVPDIIPSTTPLANTKFVIKDGIPTSLTIPKETGLKNARDLFTYGEGNVTNTPSSNNSNPVTKGGGKKTKSKRTKLTTVDSKVKKSVKRQKKPRTKKCLIEKDNKMYMSFCI
jgi:hypothetical protein